MKWFVYVDAEYYAYARICEADTAEDAAALALREQAGETYARYDDERKGEFTAKATPACAVVPFADVVFIGTENRINALVEASA